MSSASPQNTAGSRHPFEPDLAKLPAARDKPVAHCMLSAQDFQLLGHDLENKCPTCALFGVLVQMKHHSAARITHVSSSKPLSGFVSPTRNVSTLSVADDDPRQRPPKIVQPCMDRLNVETDVIILSRKTLQEKVLLHRRKRLLVTAPPASGKSSFISLMSHTLILEHKSYYLLQCKSLARADDATSRKLVEGLFKSALESKNVGKREIAMGGDLVELMLYSFDYIFIDDAHIAPYLFERFCKGIDPGIAKVVFFASVAPESFDASMPVVLFRLGWEEFRLSEEEQQTLCHMFYILMKSQNPTDVKRLNWLDHMLPTLRRDTSGHLGLLRLAAMHLWEQSFCKAFSNLPDQDFRASMDLYYQGAFFHTIVATHVRRTATADQLDDASRQILRDVLAKKAVEAPACDRGNNEDQPTLSKRALMRSVVLVPVAAGTGDPHVLQFATPLHERFWSRHA